MRTRIKFCGITREIDVDTAVAAGADAIGMVLVPGSTRFMERGRAAMIRRRLPAYVQAVTVFRNQSADAVREAIAVVRPDLLQFHGEEEPAFCISFGLPYVRAVPMKQPADLLQWSRHFATAAAMLLDSHAPGEQGGQGKTFDWSAIPENLGRPIVLAGGLTPENVGEAVRRVRPYAVDVASGVESAPGVKDPSKLRKFAEEVRRSDAA